MSPAIDAAGHGLWGIGTVVLFVGMAAVVIAYRRRAGQQQRSLEKRPDGPPG